MKVKVKLKGEDGKTTTVEKRYADADQSRAARNRAGFVGGDVTRAVGSS